MSGRKYREAIADYVRAQAKPADKFSHQPRLYQLAKRLAQGRAYDDAVLYGAAWLHDLGVFLGHRPKDLSALAGWDHLAYAARKAPAILRRLGFPPQKIPAVLEVIRTHLPSANPALFEGVLLRDADMLEQLGAIGILRTVSKTGRDTRFVRFSDGLRALESNARVLPGQLRLASARRLAKARVRAVKAFVKAAKEEAGGIEF